MLIADFTWSIFLSPFGIPIVAILAVFAWLMVASISEAVAKVMQHRTDADLKMELLARGMSSDEVVRIVTAGREVDEATEQAHVHVGHHGTPEANHY